jgi:hypothetical protein
MIIAPYPPTPDIIGSTTFKAAPTATAASKALPPSARVFTPACVASGLAELTMPDLPTAGLVVVFWLILRGVVSADSGSAVVDEEVGPAVSSPSTEPSFEEVLSKFAACVQELRIPTINTTKSILLKNTLHKSQSCQPRSRYNTR